MHPSPPWPPPAYGAPPRGADGLAIAALVLGHSPQVLASLNDPTLPPQYPGAEVLVERARNRCDSLVVDYVGGPEEAARLSLRAVVPTAEQWTANGDRWFVCLLERTYGQDLDEPLRNPRWPLR